MFSWICARCGRDNPPSATHCQNCGASFDATAEPETAEAPIATPVPSAPAPRSVSAPGRPARSGMPWPVMALIVFFAIIGIGSAIYYGITYTRNRKALTSTGLNPAADAARTRLANPLQKYVEVVGIRLLQDSKRKPQARFIVVNHSSNAIDDVAATVTLWASTSRSEEDSVGTFTFKIGSIGPNDSKELTAPLATKLKFYELPDWQNATPEIQITSP